MGLASFLNDLFDSGRVRVEPWGEKLSSADAAAAAGVLVEHERIARREFPGAAPGFLPAAALWAAEMLRRACQAAVYRDVGAAEVERALAAACPAGVAAASHYSVDLVFRFLPDLMRLAQSAAENDPLLARLRQWGVAWPYSSVGMPLAVAGETSGLQLNLDALVGDPGLLRAYVDRVIDRQDAPRLADPRVRESAAAALGAHTQLAPSISKALASHQTAAP